MQGGPAHPDRAPGRRADPRILITGVPCSGKSSIVSGVSRTFPDVVICEFGQLMARIGERQDLISGYRDLSGVPLAIRAPLQIATAKDIARLKQPVAIAAHVIVRAPEGYVEGLPEPALSYLRLTGIMLVTSDPQQIHERLSATRIAADGVGSVELIRAHQERVRKRAMEIAQSRNIPIGYIENVAGHLLNATDDAIRLWEDFLIASRRADELGVSFA